MARKREKFFEIELLPEGFTFCENPETVSLELKAAVIQNFDTKKIYVVADVEKEREALEGGLFFTFTFPLCADPAALNSWMQSNETFLCTLPAGFKLVKNNDEKSYLQCEFGRVDQDGSAFGKQMEWITKIHNSLLFCFLLNNMQHQVDDGFIKAAGYEMRSGKVHLSELLACWLPTLESPSPNRKDDCDFLKKLDEQFGGEEFRKKGEAMADIIDALLDKEAV